MGVSYVPVRSGKTPSPTIGALIIRRGFPLKGSFQGSTIGFYNIGSLIIRIGS